MQSSLDLAGLRVKVDNELIGVVHHTKKPSTLRFRKEDFYGRMAGARIYVGTRVQLLFL